MPVRQTRRQSFIRNLALAGILLSALAAPAAAVTIETVAVGNPGNAADASGRGSVGYGFEIGKYEVTNAQYAEFLNLKAKSDPFGLYNTGMGSNARGGITRSGGSGNFIYSTKANMDNKPVSYIGWYDAARFVNWLHNGQGSGDTETGAYTLAVPSGSNVTRNAEAQWFLPSTDEWIKAGYYDPTLNAGAGGYWTYPTQSDLEPIGATANAVGDISNPGANVMNYNVSAEWNGLFGNVTTVGSAGPLSESYYGTSDQGGNLYELMEDRSAATQIRRGGAWGSAPSTATTQSQTFSGFGTDFFNDGFRVATVPEPSTYVLGGMALLGLLAANRRRRGSTGHRPN